VMSYVADPGSLDAILAHLDEVRKTAYAGG
jgi:hypothetical protein